MRCETRPVSILHLTQPEDEAVMVGAAVEILQGSTT